MAVSSISSTRQSYPQAFMSSYAPRLRSIGNSLIAPVVPQASTVVTSRITKRGTTAINYAEDGYDDDYDLDESEGGSGLAQQQQRRPTGLRSLRREDSQVDKSLQIAALGKEAYQPVQVQGIWRDWMGKSRRAITRRQGQVQAELPVTLVPIRIDLEVQPFRPDAPLPTPPNAREFGIDETLAAYRQGELTPQYRIKDMFLWNLHECLTTPDQFARTFVDELDLPGERKNYFVQHISQQIRTQLEEYAGVAMHPLFQTNTSVDTSKPSGAIQPTISQLDAVGQSAPTPPQPMPESGSVEESIGQVRVTAQASSPGFDHVLNPDDTYRCIISLNVNILNRLYSDKFEWSLLHPPGYAETFAKLTCADLGLSAEWIPAIAHALYEAVLRLKKEACESGGLTSTELDNDAAEGVAAGWRYEPETLADEWAPKIELLSKEEIDRREGDRERQVRRQRRETARFSSTTNLSHLAIPHPDTAAMPDLTEQPLGRGERSKKKRRFRSPSPSATAAATPEAAAGYGGGIALSELERREWRCGHCQVPGPAVWAVRDGPTGARSLCHNCGLLYERDKRLPPWSKNLYASAVRPVNR